MPARSVRHGALALCLTLLFALLSGAALADEPSGAGDQYRLRPGDVISLSLLEHHEADVSSLIIPQDGYIAFANSGLVKAGGLTRSELEGLLEGRIAKYYLKPHVSVNLVSSSSLYIYVAGEVNKPGTYPYSDGMTLLQAEALAQGLKPTAGRKALLITHNDQNQPVTREVDLAKIEAKPANDVVLQPGDSLLIPEAFVTVAGSVGGQTGRVPIREADTVQKLLAAAHGPDANTADQGHVQVQRADGHTYLVDLRDTGPDGDPVADGPAHLHPATFPLEPGDVVVVPRLQQRVHVFGAVAQAGDVYLVPHEQDKLLDVLARVGGAPGGDLSKIILRREIGGGQQITMPLNVGDKGTPANNVIMQDGDVVVVPPKLPTTSASQRDLFYATSVLSLVATLRALGL